MASLFEIDTEISHIDTGFSHIDTGFSHVDMISHIVTERCNNWKYLWQP